MKGLKIYLTLTYVTLVILLLLVNWCCRQQTSVSPTDPELPPVKERFSADVVMCIDATASMTGILNTVKNNALRFYPDLKRESRKKGKDISSMRIRVVAFRDIDPICPMVFEQSKFFEMPEEEGLFQSFVNAISPIAGNDEPELGLDALGLAINSEWESDSKTKKVILLWTDAPTKRLSQNSLHGFNNEGQLFEKWNNDASKANKIFFFTPDDASWSAVASSLNNSIIKNVASNEGLSDLDYEEILKTISDDI